MPVNNVKTMQSMQALETQLNQSHVETKKKSLELYSALEIVISEVLKIQKAIDEEQDSLKKIYTEIKDTYSPHNFESLEQALTWEYSVRKSSLKQQKLCVELLRQTDMTKTCFCDLVTHFNHKINEQKQVEPKKFETIQ